MGKKILIIAIVLVLIAGAVVAYLFLGKKNLNYTTLSLEELKAAIMVGTPKDKEFKGEEYGTANNMYVFRNTEDGYDISVGLHDRSTTTFEDNKETASKEEGFKETAIGKYKGYEYNSASFSKKIVVSLGENEEGKHMVYEIEVTKMQNTDAPLDELMENKDIQTVVNSLKLVKYVEPKVETETENTEEPAE